MRRGPTRRSTDHFGHAPRRGLDRQESSMSRSASSAPSCPLPKAKTRRDPRHRSLSDVAAPRRGLLPPSSGWQAISTPTVVPASCSLLPATAGSVLVLDRDATTLGDRRLLAHLAPDEPPENAALVCRLYLEDTCWALVPAGGAERPGANALRARRAGRPIRSGCVRRASSSPRLRLSPGSGSRRTHDRPAALEQKPRPRRQARLGAGQAARRGRRPRKL